MAGLPPAISPIALRNPAAGRWSFMAMLGEKLLVIGDEGLARRVASLEPAWEVKLTSREQVLEAAQQEPFDLVVSREQDLNLVKSLVKRYAYLGALLLGDCPEAPPPGCLVFPERLSDRELQVALEEALEKRRLLRENRHLQALLPLFEVNRALFSVLFCLVGYTRLPSMTSRHYHVKPTLEEKISFSDFGGRFVV
jgi:hypothetical protein